MKIVLLPITVPSGEFCWNREEHQICPHFSNDGGTPGCNIFNVWLNTDKYGNVIKSKYCSKLKTLNTVEKDGTKS